MKDILAELMGEWCTGVNIGGMILKICFHGSQFTLHCTETYQRIKVCRRDLYQSDPRPSRLS